MGTILLSIASKFIIPIILAFITPAVNRVLNILEARYKIKLDGDQRQQLVNLTKDAIAKAEEFAAHKNKQNEEKKVSSQEKLNTAVKHIMKQRGVNLSVDEAEELVQSVLGQTKGAGASGEFSV